MSEFQFVADHPTTHPEEVGPDGKIKVCIGGGAGFIGSHIAKKLKEMGGYYVVCADWNDNEFMVDTSVINRSIYLFIYQHL
jgi:hypothetical protein